MTSTYHLQPKRVEAYRTVWRQLKANGYDVIPLYTGKDNPPKDWPNIPNDEASIGRWSGRAAGIRMFGGEVLVIDLDIRIERVRDAVLAMLEARWPAFMATCLRRHSGAIKLGLIGRAKTDLRTMQTHSFYPDPENLDKEQKNQVELFTGNSRKYVGVHGAHSAGREYGYHGRSIFDAPVAELPEFPATELGAMLDACEAVMAECGLFAPRPDKASGTEVTVYDLTPEQTFRLSDDTELSLAALEDLIDQEGRKEGYATIFDPAADSPDRVKANLSRTGLALWDTKTEVSHRWAHKKPIEPEQLGERLAEAGIEMESGPPKWREIYPNGSPRASLHNARIGIEAGGFVAVHDVFHNKMFLGRPGAASLPPFCGEVSDNRIILLRGWMSNRYGRDFTEKYVRDAVVQMALENPFNPITDMLADAEANWDGIKRLDRMAVEHFNCDDTPYARQCVRKTMIAAVARARNPGCKFDTILVLESPEGWNKSSAWLLLAGGSENFSDESILGKASREVQEHLADIWIHENAELAGLRKADIDVVRSYASRAEDRARPAYGHFLKKQPRQSIEVGTTNSFGGYLQAQNGNRRFWPIRLNQRIDLARLRAERLQLWGEAAHYQSAGESLTLDPDLWPAAAAEQEARRVRDPWEPLLENLAPVSVTGPLVGVGYTGNGIVHVAEGEERVATAVIFEHIIRLPSHQLLVTHAKRLADAMRALGWETKVFKLEGKAVRGYARKV